MSSLELLFTEVLLLNVDIEAPDMTCDGSNVDEKAAELGWQEEWWAPEQYIVAKAPHKGKRGLMAFSE